MSLNMLRNVVVILFCFVFITIASAQNSSKINVDQLPKLKQTTLNLYVTAKDAFSKWEANPKDVKILDVRTFEEYIFVGHAEMAQNIPVAFQTKDWDAEKGNFKLELNPNFVPKVKEWAQQDDAILVMCRSGGRSGIAVNLLAKNGFTNVYNIIDGMEGDVVKDSLSTYKGKRLRNGWKNSDIPWTYNINPEHIFIMDNRK